MMINQHNMVDKSSYKIPEEVKINDALPLKATGPIGRSLF